MGNYKPHKLKTGVFFNRLKSVLLCCFLLLFSSFKLADPIKEIKLDPIVSFDEVPVEFIVNGYLRFETDVIITDVKRVYINIEGLFKNLGISCVSNNEGDLLSGFIEKESRKYVININSHEINIDNNTIQSDNGIIKELGSIYVESTIITEAFGLNIIFNYRSLSIKLEANFELPLIKQLRLEKMRQNISKLQNNEIQVDTVLTRDYHLFKGGMVDWSFASYQRENEKTSNRVAVGLGAELLYGQANVSVYHDDKYEFTNRQLYYNWRWVDDTKKYIKQAQLGKIYSNSISFLKAPLVGASINNTPNTVRKATGFHTLQDYTEPNWTVELYINDNLVDYTEADASGLYVFKVPIVYGYTTLTLKFYGPLGEERIEERTMNVPFTFMPAKVLEYNVSGGFLEDGEQSKYGRGEINYGLNRFVTIGAGVEYLSSIPDAPSIPFANLAIQPFSKLILNFEYAHDVRMRGLLNYNLGKSAFLEVDYANYVDGQQATLFNADEERKVRLSIPFKMKKISGYTKLNFNQFVYSNFNYNQFDAVFSGYYKNYSANLSTLLNWIGDQEAYVTSNLSLSYRMRSGFVFRPSIEYNMSDNKLIRYRAEIEKRVSKLYFSAAFERNELSKTNNAFLSFRYDLPFARTGVSASYSNKKYQFSETIQGSLAFGGDNGYVKANKNSALSKGGILFYPFLDLNQNGKREKGEELVLLSNVKVSGGKANISKKDSIVRVSDLNAFINYNITFSNDELDNIAWQFKHKTYQVLVDPNQYKKVEVPILIMGEVSGMVYLNKGGNINGQRRITIQIYDKKESKVAETLSESDGYFSYLGLKPGEYSVRVDENQLKKLGYEVTPNKKNITIKPSLDGDIVDGVDFEIKSINEEKTEKITIVGKHLNDSTIKSTESKKIIKNDIIPSTVLDSLLSNIPVTNKVFYSVQIGVFNKKVTNDQLLNLESIFYEILPSKKIRYISGKFNTRKEAEKLKNKIVNLGIKDAFIVGYKKGKKIVLKRIED